MMETPSHLTCPYCPSQAYPVKDMSAVLLLELVKYECPAHHTFYIEKETDEEKLTTERG